MVNYEELYTYLVDQIDDVLQLICYDMLKAQHGREELNEVAEKLRAALLSAEEMYLDACENDEELS